MLVIDASAAIEAMVDGPRIPRLLRRVAAGDLHAPHLIDVEVLQALRNAVMRGVIDEYAAADARRGFAELGVELYPHGSLGDRIWALRHNLSAYDAAYVALAEALEAPLVTCDAKLAAAPGHGATIELFAP